MRVIGRDSEIAALVALLPVAASPSSVRQIEAAAGVGKSTVLSAVVSAATQAGVRVVRCQPTTTESHLAYAALGDLLSTVHDLTALPPVLRDALEWALLRAPAAGSAEVDARSVGAACSAVWALLAAQGPVVIVVDDVQWLDAASAAALLFSFRRLPEHAVMVLSARRSDEAGPRLGTDSVDLAPLAAESVMTLLSERAESVATPLTARQMRAIVEASAGNPLFALELAREAERTGRGVPGSLAVPASLDDAIWRRFDALSADVHEALAAVALVAKPELAVIRRMGISQAIEVAEREGLVDSRSGRVVFGHPLFASIVLGRTAATALRALHGRLAAVVDDPTAAVRHAACAAEAPDDELAGRLDSVVASLVARGAIEHAAEFAALAARLSTASAPERHERFVVAAHLAFQSGDGPVAQELLGQIDAEAVEATTRVRELIVRAKVEFSVGGASLGPARRALDHCTTDAERIEVHSLLGRISYDNFEHASEHAAEAYRLAATCELGPAVRASVLVALAGAKFMTGQGLDRALYAEAIELEGTTVGYAADSAFASLAVLLKIADELDESRSMLLEILRCNEDDGALPFVLSHLPQLELWTGNWEAAEEYAQRHLEAALRTGQHEQVMQARNNITVIDIYRGDVSEASGRAEEIRQAGVSQQDAWTERNGLGLLGLIAMTEGDAERAVQLLSAWHAMTEAMALREPGYCRMQADYVEALVATGRLDVAAAFAASMQESADRLGRPSLLAGAARVRSLIAAARGERDMAVQLAKCAVDQFGTTPLVVEHARALLTLGQIHRRFKEKSAARAALSAALEVFERLGALRFAERARQDLARIGLRAPTSDSLTETERRVAHLAATGKTVRQVGDELFISPKTVEANLTRVYRKLGLSGRAELATWVATTGPAPVARERG